MDRLLRLTFRLLLFVEHHQVQRVVEVLGHLGHVMTRQPVGAVDRLVLQVRPVDTILKVKGADTK